MKRRPETYACIQAMDRIAEDHDEMRALTVETITRLTNRVEQLETRLEISRDHDVDGIEARDESIVLLDERVEQLKASNTRLHSRLSCAVCGGFALAEDNCICGGSGRVEDAEVNARVELLKLREENQRLEKQLGQHIESGWHALRFERDNLKAVIQQVHELPTYVCTFGGMMETVDEPPKTLYVRLSELRAKLGGRNE